jgi:NADPH2:quinone reductase
VKAIQALGGEAAKSLSLVEVPEPRGEGLLVEVESAGVAYPDVLQIRGEYQTRRPFPFVPGSEAVGKVVQAPARLASMRGTRVVVLSSEGSWQERLIAHPNSVFPVPARLSPTQASLLLVNYVTAHFALARRATARAGETLLVHGAAGGVGSAAVQIGTALGLRTIAVVSSPAKAEYASSLGASHVVLTPNWKSDVQELAGSGGVNIVFDPVGGERFLDSLRILAPEGRLLVIGFVGGPVPEVKVNRLLLRNIGVLGVATGPFMQEAPRELRRHWGRVASLIDKGLISVPDATTFTLADAQRAVESLEQRTAIGKVALVTTSADSSKR